MSIPLAVSPGTLAPGLYLIINLAAGAASPGIGELRTLILCPKASTGTLVVDSEIRTGEGADSGGVAFGVGSPGHLMAKHLYAEYPTAVIDFGAPTAGAGTATRTFVISGVPTSTNAIVINICGREFEVAWLVGETADNMRDKCIAAINARTTDLPVVASSGGAGTVTIDSKVTGNIGNDILFYTRLSKVATGTEATTVNTPTALVGGAADPDMTTILTKAQGREYHLIVLGISNADAETAGATSNVERALLHVQSYNSGLDAKLQQVLYATSLTRANARTAAVARNVGWCEQVNGLDYMSLPCEIAAAEAGNRLAAISIDPAANRIGNLLGGKGVPLYGSVDPVGDKPTQASNEADLGSGVTPLTYDAQGNTRVVRPITTYCQTATGAPDRRILDVSIPDATYIVARDIRSALPAQFPNAKIQKDSAPGEDPPPEGVLEERDIRAFVISRLRVWARNGVILNASLTAAINSGELIVRVNPLDATQVDLVLPFNIVPPLAKFGVVINRVPS